MRSYYSVTKKESTIGWKSGVPGTAGETMVLAGARTVNSIGSAWNLRVDL